jgi:hypothetical protein
LAVEVLKAPIMANLANPAGAFPSGTLSALQKFAGVRPVSSAPARPAKKPTPALEVAPVEPSAPVAPVSVVRPLAPKWGVKRVLRSGVVRRIPARTFLPKTVDP